MIMSCVTIKSHLNLIIKSAGHKQRQGLHRLGPKILSHVHYRVLLGPSHLENRAGSRDWLSLRVKHTMAG